MKISFDLNISLDKEKKDETANTTVKEMMVKESRTESVESAPKAIASSTEGTAQNKTEESVKASEIASDSAQHDAESSEKKAPSKLDKVISVAKDGKELYDSGKEVLEMVSSIKMRGIIACAALVLSIVLIIITPIFCYSWPKYQLKNRAENTAAEALDKTAEVLEDVKNLAEEKKDELAPKLNEAKEGLGNKLDNAKTQAADTLDNAKIQAADTLDNAKIQAADTLDNVKTQAADTLDNVKTQAADTLDNVKTQAADTLDNVKIQAADTLDNAGKAMDAKLDSVKKWLNGDDTHPDAEPTDGDI